MKPTEVEIDRITPRRWRRILQASRDLDLNKGGYCDGRSGCINFWCGPDDKPAGWPDEVAITRGALDHPRSYVAFVHVPWEAEAELGLTWDWDDDRTLWPVRADITCYDVQEWRVRQARAEPRPAWSDEDAVAAWVERRRWLRSPAAYRVDGDEAWLLRQWRRLKEYTVTTVATRWHGYN